MEQDEELLEDEIEDEGTEEDLDDELNNFIPDEEDTQEEGGDEDDSVVDEITRQVAMLGSSISEITLLGDSILASIFKYIPLKGLLSASLVCVSWHQIIISNYAIWKSVYNSIPFPITTYLPTQSYYDRCVLSGQRKAILREYNGNEDDVLQMVIEGEQVDIGELELLVAAPMFATCLQSGEPNLLDLLQEKWVITGLLDLMLRPSNDWNEERLRVSHLCFQTLGSDLLLDEFIEDSSLLDALFYFLETVNRHSTPEPSSAYFSRFVGTLFEQHPSEMMTYCKQHLRMIGNLVENVHNSYLMEILYKLVDSNLIHQRLIESQLFYSLAMILDQNEPIERQEHATEVTMSVLTLCQPWGETAFVKELLNSSKTITRILEYIKSPPVSQLRVQNGLKILVSALQLIGDECADEPLLVTMLAVNIEYFALLLKDLSNSDAPNVSVTFGEVKLFGFVRLGILELFLSLMCTGFPIVVNVMVSNKVFSLLLDLLFEYKWNNIVHHQIAKMFSCLLYCNNHELMKSVIKECNILNRIVEAHEADTNTCGYLGHLRDLANELVNVAEHSPPIAILMKENHKWQEFENSILEDWNELECDEDSTHDFDDDDDDDIDVVLCDAQEFEDAEVYEEYEIDIDDAYDHEDDY